MFDPHQDSDFCATNMQMSLWFRKSGVFTQNLVGSIRPPVFQYGKLLSNMPPTATLIATNINKNNKQEGYSFDMEKGLRLLYI